MNTAHGYLGLGIGLTAYFAFNRRSAIEEGLEAAVSRPTFWGRKQRMSGAANTQWGR